MDSRKKTRKITVRISKRLKTEMQSALIRSGYGLRGKSRWLNETIASFLNQNHFIDFVEHGIDINQAELTEVEAFYLNAETIQQLQEAFVKIRIKYPLFEGVQSAIIRASIIYQLMLK